LSVSGPSEKIASVVRWARSWPVAIVLGANALDLSTSLVPYWIDRFYTPSPRGTLGWSVQLALLLLAAALYLPRLPALFRTLAALPIPKSARIVCLSFVALELVHIALRYERYPFSPVAMFSDAHLEVPETWERDAFMVRHPEGVRLLSFQREGDPFFARYFDDLDYKGSAALRMYKSEPGVVKLVEQVLAQKGLPPPEPVTIVYRTSDGKLLAIGPRVAEEP
jgi:hypothetical protein